MCGGAAAKNNCGGSLPRRAAFHHIRRRRRRRFGLPSFVLVVGGVVCVVHATPFHAAAASRSPHSNCIKNSVTKLYFALVSPSATAFTGLKWINWICHFVRLEGSNLIHDALLVDCLRGSAAFAQHAVRGGGGDILRILRARCLTDCAAQAQPSMSHQREPLPQPCDPLW